MSHCVVPNWNLRHQRQQEEVEGEEGNRSSHVHNHLQNPIHMKPAKMGMYRPERENLYSVDISGQYVSVDNTPTICIWSNYEVAELTWENGQLAMHELGGLLPTTPIKPTWNRAGDTLESIVHQATCQNPNNMNSLQHDQNPANLCSINVASSCGGGAAAGSSSRVPTGMDFFRKRTRTETDQCGRNFSSSVQGERLDRSVCASASATFCRDNDTTKMTWASFESPRSLKTKTADDDSACHGGSENRDEDRDTKFETGRSHTMRRTRAADIHNQSERRRRDRINQKMKALQKLVPNSSKTDKASMLDEVIDYLKQLQAQIQMMNAIRNMPQMMLPIGIHQQQQQQQQQHQLQMSLLARMGAVGLGMGVGMLDMNSMAARTAALIHPSPVAAAAAAAATPTFVPPPFVMSPMIPTRTLTPQPNSVPASSAASVPMHDPYSALLAQQTMNLDLYNKMAALYRQQVSQTTQAATTPSQSKHHGQRN